MTTTQSLTTLPPSYGYGLDFFSRQRFVALQAKHDCNITFENNNSPSGADDQ